MMIIIVRKTQIFILDNIERILSIMICIIEKGARGRLAAPVAAASDRIVRCEIPGA